MIDPTMAADAVTILAQFGDINPQQIPGTEERVSAGLSYFMWGCIAIGILGVMAAGAYFIMSRRSGNSEEAQSTVIRILGGSILIAIAGPLITALVG